MRKWIVTGIVVCMVLCMGAAPASAGMRIGGGANYWMALSDIDVDVPVDEDGLSWLVSLQFELAELFKLEADLEVFGEDFGGAGNTVYAPQAYAILGSAIYAGVGVGGYYADGDFAEDAFYGICAGLDLEILPNVHLDIRGNYRFSNWEDLTEGVVFDDLDTDTITLGAAARIEF